MAVDTILPQLICKWKLEGANHLEVRVQNNQAIGLKVRVLNTQTQTMWQSEKQFPIGSVFDRCVWKGNHDHGAETRFFRSDLNRKASRITVDIQKQIIHASTFDHFNDETLRRNNLDVDPETGISTWKTLGERRENAHDPLAETGMIRTIGGIEEAIVKIWSKVGADGAVVHLIRSGGGLIYSLMRPASERIVAPFALPQGRSVEDAIAILSNRRCEVGDDNSVRFVRQPDPEHAAVLVPELALLPGPGPMHVGEEVVKVWPDARADGAVVQLVRLGNTLKYAIIPPVGLTIKLPVVLPDPVVLQNELGVRDRMSIENIIKSIIEKLNNLECVLGLDNIVRFKSEIDKEILIDNDNWALTLINGGLPYSTSNPLTWGGHANIYIESMENGVPFLRRAHLVSSRTDSYTGHISMKYIKYDLNEVNSKSVTWLRSREKVEKMIRNIEHDIESQCQGYFPVGLDLRGQGARGVKYIDDNGNVIHNCYTWAKSKLELADLFLYQGASTDVLDRTSILKMPKLRINHDSVYSRERIAPLGIDITEELHEILGKKPWKLIKIQTGLNQEQQQIKIQGKTLFVIPKSEDINRITIRVKVSGEEEQNIDMTEFVKEKLRAKEKARKSYNNIEFQIMMKKRGEEDLERVLDKRSWDLDRDTGCILQ